ncbi:hypothetical protein AM1_H0104 (plasmid) [Acaryochloris marina MBIC11017]|uniref:Uncharacterized protein n=1 Tax=Acaryochloris marina (strain MBIC 11017) TaxID=329726 RepID=A8ZR18_ACAM1|nr:hypothetical protein AM1_H0104 [Acaryochloris marina MBIC11017]
MRCKWVDMSGVEAVACIAWEVTFTKDADLISGKATNQY